MVPLFFCGVCVSRRGFYKNRAERVPLSLLQEEGGANAPDDGRLYVRIKAKNKFSVEKFSSAVRRNAEKILLLNFYLTYVDHHPAYGHPLSKEG